MAQLDQRFMRFLVTQASGKIKAALEHSTGTGAEPSLREAQVHVTELSQAIDDYFAESQTTRTAEPQPTQSGRGRGRASQ